MKKEIIKKDETLIIPEELKGFQLKRFLRKNNMNFIHPSERSITSREERIKKIQIRNNYMKSRYEMEVRESVEKHVDETRKPNEVFYTILT